MFSRLASRLRLSLCIALPRALSSSSNNAQSTRQRTRMRATARLPRAPHMPLDARLYARASSRLISSHCRRFTMPRHQHSSQAVASLYRRHSRPVRRQAKRNVLLCVCSGARLGSPAPTRRC
eukprot:6198820-Pleurochrysis_carterae.AAC.1